MRRCLWSFGIGLLLLPGAVAAILVMIWWVCPRGRGRQYIEIENETRRLRQHVCVEFTIPENMVGYVIGKRGMRVRQVEEDSGAHVQFKDLMTDKGKVVVIRGRTESVAGAEQTIRKIVEDQLQAGANQVETTISIPSCTVGRLIGRQGVNIKRLQQESGARINVNSGYKSEDVRQCVVRGSQEAVDTALSLISSSIKETEKLLHTSKLASLQRTKLSDKRDYFPTFVSAVNIQGEVWLQPLHKNDPEELEVLVDTMTIMYSQPCPPCSSIEVGSVCAAPFEHDTKWYRVSVTHVHREKGLVDVVYVDYGDKGSVTNDLLKPLKSELTHLPMQAVCCCLHGIKPKGGVWSEEALLRLEELTHCGHWRPMMVKLMDESEELPSIEIIDTTTNYDVNIAKEMVNSGYAESSF